MHPADELFSAVTSPPGGCPCRHDRRRTVRARLGPVARSGGARAMITVTAERARAEAEVSDQRRRTGTARSDLDGVPIMWKDVFDVEGTVTTAGSATRSATPRAPRDSRLVRRASELGLVTVGKTNLSEFAFSGLGINQNFGTPHQSEQRGPDTRRVVLRCSGGRRGRRCSAGGGNGHLRIDPCARGLLRVRRVPCEQASLRTRRLRSPVADAGQRGDPGQERRSHRGARQATRCRAAPKR